MSEISQEVVDDTHENSANNAAAIAIPVASMTTVGTEIDHLANRIKLMHDSPGHISFWMSVNVNTAKASLVPIPTYDNMMKMKENYDRLPKRVRNTVRKNMSEDDFQTFQSIMGAFRQGSPEAIEQFEDNGNGSQVETVNSISSSDIATNLEEEKGSQ